MMKLDPPIVIRPLSEVAPGSLVQLGRERGFCAFSRRDPSQKLLVMYDPERLEFHLRLTPVAVLDMGSNLVIAPNLQSLVENLEPSSEATTELLLRGDSPKLVFRGGDIGPRLLDLKTGAIELLERGPGMTAFREWTVGVNTVSAGILPFLDVGPPFGAAFEDTGPLEPVKV